VEAALEQFNLALEYSRYLPEIQDALVFRKLARIQADTTFFSSGSGGGGSGDTI